MAESYARKLLEIVEESGDVDATMALLDEFFRGFPVENLRLLLSSESDVAVKSGAFLASELGEQVQPIWKDAAMLIDYPDPRVRGDVLDCILLCSRPSDAKILARTVNLLSDPHPGIRWKILQFFARLGPAHLMSAASLSPREECKALTWLAELARGEVPATTIGSALTSSVWQERLIAVSAAVRVYKSDPKWLELAASSTYPEVHSIAKDLLDLEERKSERRRDLS